MEGAGGAEGERGPAAPYREGVEAPWQRRRSLLVAALKTVSTVLEGWGHGGPPCGMGVSLPLSYSHSALCRNTEVQNHLINDPYPPDYDNPETRPEARLVPSCLCITIATVWKVWSSWEGGVGGMTTLPTGSPP